MSMTKEELVIENARLQNETAIAQMSDVKIRREFAKAFGWFKPKRQYDDGSNEPITPTWEQIFIHVGGLLVKADGLNFKEAENIIGDLQRRVENIEMETQH